jgi:hypothetical protein
MLSSRRPDHILNRQSHKRHGQPNHQRHRHPRNQIMVTMDRAPQPVKDPPNLIRSAPFSLDRLLSHVDPGTAEESEDLVKRIYGQRNIDLASDHNGKTGS